MPKEEADLSYACVAIAANMLVLCVWSKCTKRHLATPERMHRLERIVKRLKRARRILGHAASCDTFDLSCAAAIEEEDQTVEVTEDRLLERLEQDAKAIAELALDKQLDLCVRGDDVYLSFIFFFLSSRSTTAPSSTCPSAHATLLHWNGGNHCYARYCRPFKKIPI